MFRTPLWHRTIAVGAFLVLAGTAARTSMDAAGILRVLCLLAGIGFLAAAWRARSLRIEASDEGVLIVNWRKSVRLSWPSIQRFDYEFGLNVLMRDGTEQQADVFGIWFVPGGGQLDSQIARSGRQLQDELRQRRAPHRGR